MVDRINLHIRKFVNDLLFNGAIDTCKDYVRIDRPHSGSNAAKENNCDRFRLSIPYGGTTLKWEVLFNSDEPHLPPDFVFGNHEQDFEPNLEEIQALQYWNPDDPNSLAAVVKELIHQYKQYHCELVKRYCKKVFNEYKSLQDNGFFCNTEVYIHRSAQVSQQQVSFIIKLPIDLTKLPPYLIHNNLGEDYITLNVLYEGYDGSIVTPRIFLSPRVEHAFADQSLQYPNWAASDECLISYIPLVQSFFSQKAEEITLCYERRREYVAAFLSTFGSAVVEYDAEEFTKIAFLLQLQGFYCMLKIELSKAFPEDQPVFVFHSVYTPYNDEPFSAKDKVYPYSPRWSATEMTSRARSYLLNAIPAFKIASISKTVYIPPQR